MTTEKTEGIVIRQADFSESSRVVTFFTRDWGKISTVAKGAKRLKGPFDAAIDLLTRCRIVFIRKATSSLDILTESQLISRFSPNQRDLKSLYGGYYVGELLNGLTEEYDPHPELYDVSVETLDELQHGDEPHFVIIRFELEVLREIGQLPAFDECLVCNNPTGNDPSGQDGPYSFWVSQGGVICRNCREEKYTRHDIHSVTMALLGRLSAGLATFDDLKNTSKKQQREIRSMTTTAISHALGRQPKMLRYLK